jgi:uncharacterized protein (TIGR02246 family)
MTRLIIPAQVILVFLVACATPLSESSTQEREIATLVEQYEDGIRNRDASVHERLFAPDYTYTPGNGALMGRTDHMAFTTSGAVALDTLWTEEPDVRVFGTAAVATGRWVGTGMRLNRPTQFHVRYLLVFVKRAGVWKIVAEQRTNVA